MIGFRIQWSPLVTASATSKTPCQNNNKYNYSNEDHRSKPNKSTVNWCQLFISYLQCAVSWRKILKIHVRISFVKLNIVLLAKAARSVSVFGLFFMTCCCFYRCARAFWLNSTAHAFERSCKR